MRSLTTHRINQFRVRTHLGIGDSGNGAFRVPSPIDGADMYVIASDGAGWDHVSVSRKNRCPNWPEMEHARKLFFEPHEVVMQLHVTDEEHVNLHPNCLHLWRPQAQEIPLPPSWMVGPKRDETLAECLARGAAEHPEAIAE